jgi:hypothetical protein
MASFSFWIIVLEHTVGNLLIVILFYFHFVDRITLPKLTLSNIPIEGDIIWYKESRVKNVSF